MCRSAASSRSCRAHSAAQTYTSSATVFVLRLDRFAFLHFILATSKASLKPPTIVVGTALSLSSQTRCSSRSLLEMPNVILSSADATSKTFYPNLSECVLEAFKPSCSLPPNFIELYSLFMNCFHHLLHVCIYMFNNEISLFKKFVLFYDY